MWRTNSFENYKNKFVAHYFNNYTIPTIADVTTIIGVSSHASAHNFYKNMVTHGYLGKDKWKYHPTDKLLSFPLFESVQAWFPSPATDELKDEMRIETYLIDNPAATILVKVKGDSMIDAWIHDGDTIILEKGAKHAIGDIVVAVVDNDYTLKYLAEEKGNYYLKPWNKEFDDIYPTETLEILWVVKWSFRRYD